MKKNIEKIHPSTLNAMKDHGNNNLTHKHKLNVTFDTNIFDDIKYDLLHYDKNNYVLEAIDLYVTTFATMEKYDEVNKLHKRC
ncbi:hypothetical protein [Aquibacillus albus]|uniref:Uncharacterized protein n=1 Tax=Aquibacillus albus TaxID=1168171 RepID=A0ABS2N3L6_9BACI|nr:hypothetical protein [Aquibacillus albus]MBM7572669.1 hypothetical protein [Aquibacillus albus]